MTGEQCHRTSLSREQFAIAEALVTFATRLREADPDLSIAEAMELAVIQYTAVDRPIPTAKEAP